MDELSGGDAVEDAAEVSAGVIAGWRLLSGMLAGPAAGAGALLLVFFGLLSHRIRTLGRRERRERARREEIEAYGQLQVKLQPEGDGRKLAEQAKRVCRLVVDKSVFRKAALLLPDAEGRMVCAGSCGMDDLTIAALHEWAERRLREESAAGSSDRSHLTSNGHKRQEMGTSFCVVLGNRKDFDAMPGLGCYRATIVPLRMPRGRLVGALALCGEAEELGDEAALELLAAKLTQGLERSMLIERLMQVERLAGAGHLVAGVAQELAHPLTTVLGKAELLAETAAEPRARADAEVIVQQARQMEATLETLRDFWQPTEKQKTR